MFKFMFFCTLLVAFSAQAQTQLSLLESAHDNLMSMDNNDQTNGLRKSESGILTRGDLVHNLSVMLVQTASDLGLKPNVFYKISVNDFTDAYGLESFRLEQLHYYVELIYDKYDLVRPNLSITSWESLEENIRFLKSQQFESKVPQVVVDMAREPKNIETKKVVPEKRFNCEEY